MTTYYSDEWRKRTFEILADGQHIGDQTVEKDGSTPHFFDVTYAIPAEVVKDKQKVTVRFQAHQRETKSARFLGFARIRADAEK